MQVREWQYGPDRGKITPCPGPLLCLPHPAPASAHFCLLLPPLRPILPISSSWPRLASTTTQPCPVVPTVTYCLFPALAHSCLCSLLPTHATTHSFIAEEWTGSRASAPDSRASEGDIGWFKRLTGSKAARALLVSDVQRESECVAGEV